MRAAVAMAAATWIAACQGPGTAPSVSSADGPLTIDRILARPSITGTSPSAPAWSPDGKQLVFLWNDHGTSNRDLWTVEADGSSLRRVGGDSETGVREFAWFPDSERLALLRADELKVIGAESSSLLRSRPLANSLGGASTLAVSPDGRFVSFLRHGDLWLFELASRELRRLTDVAVPSTSSLPLGRYSRRDVEIGPYVWGGPSYAWSPDSSRIAIHHVDRRGMGTVPFPDYLADETDPNPVRRGYPGEPNEARTVGVVDVGSGDVEWLALPDPTANRVVDFDWSPDGRLLVDRESDTAVDRRLHVFDFAAGGAREIVNDRRDSRIYTFTGSSWLAGGERVVFVSDREDRYGLYVWSDGAAEPKRVTSRDSDVTTPPITVGDSSTIWFHANEPSPYEQHVFRVDANGGAPVRVTSLAGHNRGFPSPDGGKLAVLHSDDRTPTELYLVDPNEPGSEQRITHSTSGDFDDRDWATVRYVTFPSHVDGATLHARVMEPPNLEPGRRYPVIFGPVYSNTVRNRWGGRWSLLQQALVSRGAIVVQVDVRGSTGYGRAFREAFLMDFAGLDLEDVESAARHMRTLPHVDPDRFGIWGSSYGGTLTIYALLKKPGLFQAGVAGAAAVDPRFFGTDDVAIVRRPDSHPEAFLRGAAQYAANLEDHLLIIHGMQDQVVPFKTTVALAEALMREGKDFDFAFAPRGTHGWAGPTHYARYLFGKLVGHFDRHLFDAD